MAVSISKILKDTEYKFDQFSQEQIFALESSISVKTDKNGKELVMEQLSEGSLLTVTFLKDKTILVTGGGGSRNQYRVAGCFPGGGDHVGGASAAAAAAAGPAGGTIDKTILS